jgi:hypothetical protein
VGYKIPEFTSSGMTYPAGKFHFSSEIIRFISDDTYSSNIAYDKENYGLI